MIVSNNNVCPDDTGYIKVSIKSLLSVDAGPSVTIASGSQTQLNACCGNIYSWYPATGLSCVDCSNPFASPEETTTYTITILDSSGCESSDTVTIFVETGFFIPNMFSPNKDGANDIFKLFGYGIKEINFKVYNRWGNIIWEAKTWEEASKIGWDGTYQGENQPNGVYVWYIKGIFADGKEIDYEGKTTGTILLLR